MHIEFDPVKRNRTLLERGLDFEKAEDVFAGRHLTQVDDRYEYPEVRMRSTGRLDGRIVIVVWTPRGDARRIISMRKANEREIAIINPALDRS